MAPLVRTLSRIAASAGAVALLAVAVMLWSRSEGGRADAAASSRATPAAAAGEARPLPAAADAELVAEEDPFTLLAEPAPTRPLSREEKRFARADRNDDGFVSQAEFLANRRRNFDRLDRNRDGVLSFEEYAAEGIRKFGEADRNGDARLDAAEFAATARPPKTQTAARGAPPCECS